MPAEIQPAFPGENRRIDELLKTVPDQFGVVLRQVADFGFKLAELGDDVQRCPPSYDSGMDRCVARTEFIIKRSAVAKLASFLLEKRNDLSRSLNRVDTDMRQTGMRFEFRESSSVSKSSPCAP